jgi:capsular exopolysaccharide synthesis family protein
MSKHFDLMQRMERERSLLFGADAIRDPLPQRANVDTKREQRCASNETLRLVQQIFLLQSAPPPRVVVFAGIDHGNGCSEVCVATAEKLAQHARREVCLVEANFRSPALPEMFGTTNHYGLTNALLEKGSIDSFAKPVNSNNLWLLSSGALAADSPNLLSSGRLKERLEELRERFEFVIIDSPPLNQYSDAIAIGQFVDGLVLVLEADSTRRESASAVAATLRAARIPILAAVLNKRTFPIPQKIYNRL